MPTSKAEALEKFDKELVGTRAALVATTGDTWDRNWQLVWQGKAWIDQPKHQVFRDAVLNHMIHHRGQLTVYLRLLNAQSSGDVRAECGRNVRRAGNRAECECECGCAGRIRSRAHSHSH